MRTGLRIGVVLLVAAVLIGAGALVLRRQAGTAEAEATQPTAVVTRGNIEELVSATGNVQAERQATLAFETSGRIAEVLVNEGEAVQAGDVLAHLDTDALEWQIARAQASLDTAQARLDQAQQPASEEELASAQAALDSALANLEQTKDGASTEELASARAALTSARTNYDQVRAGPTKEDLAAVQAALDSAKASVQQAQASYDRIKHRPDAQMQPEALNLQNATISLEQAQANYDAVANRPTESELSSAQAQVAQAEATLAQLEERPTESELASATSQVAQAQATLTQILERPNPEDVAVFQAQVDETAVALAQAQAQLEDALLVAPFAGTILSTQIQEGEWATPGAPAITLAAIEPLILDVNVDEIDVAHLAEGQAAYLNFDALRALQAEPVVGTITRIAPSASNVGGAVAYSVEISFSPGELPVRLGMTADIDMVVGSAENALLVPNRAITADRQSDRYYVTRQLPDGTLQRLEVRIGLRDESQTQIVEGVDEGDTVVLPELPAQSSSDDDAPFGGGGPFGEGRPGGGQ
jgi:RND family efflux transporter MFP subunit